MSSSILSAALGLAVIFAAFALLASGVQEVIASLISMRGKTLINALDKLGDDEAAKILNSKLLKPLGQEKAPAKQVVAADGKPPPVHAKNAPSYIPSWMFAASVVQRVKDDFEVAAQAHADSPEGDAPTLEGQVAAMAGPLGDVVRSVWNEANGEVDKVQAGLAKWYDSYMERVSGWYKRKSRYILFAVGLIICLVANVDAISLTRTVLDNSQVQSVLNQDAANTKACAAGTSQVNCALNAISNLPGAQLGLFWVPTCTPAKATAKTKAVVCATHFGGWFKNRGLNHRTDYLWKFLGIILGAFAISLGAPFWFDLIGRGVALKGAGQTPPPAAPSSS